jgi:hypothetical protein
MKMETIIPTTRSMVHVLLVASDPWQSQCVELALTESHGQNFDVCRRPTIADAMEDLPPGSFDVVLWHLDEANKSFLNDVADFRRRDTATPLIVIAAPEEESLAVGALGEGCDEYLLETEIGGDALARSIRRAIEHRKLRTDFEELTSKCGNCEAQLKRTSQLVAESSDSTQRLTGSFSHEIRTPLTVVQEYCALMRDGLAGPVTADQCRYLEIVTDRVGDLNRLLNDFVDSPALESGTLAIRRAPARLVDIVENLRSVLLAKAAIRQAQLEIWVSTDLPSVYCDAQIVSRVICNLLAQALKSTRDAGAVRIWAEHAPDQRQIVLAVADNAVGATPEHPETVLRTFALAAQEPDAALARGTFNLVMSQKLAHANFGELGVHRDPLRGTTYFLSLPEVDPDVVMAAYLRERTRRGDEPSSMALVLVSLDVESGSAMADSLDEVLYGSIASADLVLRLEPFVWALIVDASRQQPQLVVARVHDAWAQSNRGKHPPEILVEVKALYHFTPQDRKTPMPITAGSPSPAQEAVVTPRILLVDDDRSIVEALRLRLRLSGYEVETAHDGQQGLAVVGQRHVDLILLDIRMPVMDGLAMLAKLQEDKSRRQIPVVMVSASHDDRGRALELGARYFIEKPYDPNVLKVTIAAVLGRTAPQECGSK